MFEMNKRMHLIGSLLSPVVSCVFARDVIQDAAEVIKALKSIECVNLFGTVRVREANSGAKLKVTFAYECVPVCA